MASDAGKHGDAEHGWASWRSHRFSHRADLQHEVLDPTLGTHDHTPPLPISVDDLIGKLQTMINKNAREMESRLLTTLIAVVRKHDAKLSTVIKTTIDGEKEETEDDEHEFADALHDAADHMKPVRARVR